MVSKIKFDLLFFKSIPKCCILILESSDILIFYPPILYQFHLTSFFRPDNLKRKLTVCTEVGIAGYAILFHTEGLAKCHMGPTVSLLRLVVRNRSLQTGSQTGLFEVFYIDRSITPLIWNKGPFLYETQVPSNLAIDPLLFASHSLCCSNLKRL